jgi:hypothetical protein
MAQQKMENTFDQLAKGLSSGEVSRGKALRLMGAALVGGTLASLGGVATADDECKPNGKKCRKDAQCCSGNCDSISRTCACRPNGGSCASNGQCCSGNCESGTCILPPGPTRVLCTCRDRTVIERCSSAGCFSGPERAEVCQAVCASHGGAAGTGAFCNDPVCTG